MQTQLKARCGSRLSRRCAALRHDSSWIRRRLLASVGPGREPSPGSTADGGRGDTCDGRSCNGLTRGEARVCALRFYVSNGGDNPRRFGSFGEQGVRPLRRRGYVDNVRQSRRAPAPNGHGCGRVSRAAVPSPYHIGRSFAGSLRVPLSRAPGRHPASGASRPPVVRIYESLARRSPHPRAPRRDRPRRERVPRDVEARMTGTEETCRAGIYFARVDIQGRTKPSASFC
jgi:hypothetical protein